MTPGLEFWKKMISTDWYYVFVIQRFYCHKGPTALDVWAIPSVSAISFDLSAGGKEQRKRKTIKSVKPNIYLVFENSWLLDQKNWYNQFFWWKYVVMFFDFSRKLEKLVEVFGMIYTASENP